MRALYFAASSLLTWGVLYHSYIAQKVIIRVEVEMKVVCQVIGKLLNIFNGGYFYCHILLCFVALIMYYLFYNTHINC